MNNTNINNRPNPISSEAAKTLISMAQAMGSGYALPDMQSVFHGSAAAAAAAAAAAVAAEIVENDSKNSSIHPQKK